MNLIIDIGNSLVKLALFDKKDLVQKTSIPKPEYNLIESFSRQAGKPDGIILSSVRKDDTEIIERLKDLGNTLVVLDENTSLPILNLYKTKSTLGYDRIASLAGAQERFPGKAVLVIDAGTAITYDVLTEKGEFRGGNISPGAIMRARSLNYFTSRLPLVDPFRDFPYFGEDTEGALSSGILQGIIHEMEGYMHRFTENNPRSVIILTGGDAMHFDKKVKNSIFVDQNLSLHGLRRILEYNAK